LRSVITGQQSPLSALTRGAGDLILGGLSKTVQGLVVGGQGGENGQPGDLAAGISKFAFGQTGGIAGLLGGKFGPLSDLLGGTNKAGSEGLFQAATVQFQTAVAE